MPSIAIITDTDASLSFELAGRYNIRQVPITIHFGEELLRANYDIDDQGLFERIDREGVLPTTSAPAPGAFAAAYEEAFKEGADTVICITVSGEISATYTAAMVAAETMPGNDITVIDSRNLSLAQGFVVLAAAEAAQAGASKDEIAAHARDIATRTHLYASLDTLKYLAMSGRVGHLAAGMANVLNIKPILTMQDGKLEMLEKVRTRKKATARVVELTKEALGDQPIERMGFVHVAAPEGMATLEEQVRAAIDCPEEVTHGELTAGLSVHSGKGMVGVTFVTGK